MGHTGESTRQRPHLFRRSQLIALLAVALRVLSSRFPQPHPRLIPVRELDAGGFKDAHNGIHGLHISGYGSLGPLETLDRLDGYGGPPSEISLFDSSHRARSTELLPGDDQITPIGFLMYLSVDCS
jgi:hypothetical protein